MALKYVSFFLFGIFFGSVSLIAQNDINQMDANGKRQGVWQKKFPGTNQLRYEGQFKHGKEVGVFKFYCEDCKSQPMVVKTFNDNDNIALVQYYTKKGKLVSEGKMDGKKRIGEWLYFHKSSSNVMTRETYIDGKLQGKKLTYYPHGQIAEEENYVDGLKQGENNYYGPKGELLKKLTYQNDKLEGKGYYYDASGNIEIEGTYKKGRKHGLWKYYENGKLTKEETFPKPLKKANN